jgi:hypothetical protein
MLPHIEEFRKLGSSRLKSLGV